MKLKNETSAIHVLGKQPRPSAFTTQRTDDSQVRFPDACLGADGIGHIRGQCCAIRPQTELLAKPHPIGENARLPPITSWWQESILRYFLQLRSIWMSTAHFDANDTKWCNWIFPRRRKFTARSPLMTPTRFL